MSPLGARKDQSPERLPWACSSTHFQTHGITTQTMFRHIHDAKLSFNLQNLKLLVLGGKKKRNYIVAVVKVGVLDEEETKTWNHETNWPPGFGCSISGFYKHLNSFEAWTQQTTGHQSAPAVSYCWSQISSAGWSLLQFLQENLNWTGSGLCAGHVVDINVFLEEPFSRSLPCGVLVIKHPFKWWNSFKLQSRLCILLKMFVVTWPDTCRHLQPTC